MTEKIIDEIDKVKGKILDQDLSNDLPKDSQTLNFF